MINYGIFLLVFTSIFFYEYKQAEEDKVFPANKVVPSEKQIAYQEMEVIGFIHFGVNTFTDREWGTGKEDPAIFDPSQLDAHQWARTAQAGGMKMLILTAKHHDGFCLWPSAMTDHSVERSPWQDGTGDVVEELKNACELYGLKMGLYLSPWDMHEPKYGTDEYNSYYLSQLEELLTNYGTITEVWMDGAKGKNAKDMEYDFVAYRKLIYDLQPDALIFSDVGPDIRWIGNEHGIAGETNWSMITTDGMEIGEADTKYLNTGDPDGEMWLVGECDVSIRPGWFYHSSQDDQVKTPRQLIDLYYKSVGRNGTLLLNLPPDKRGLIHENDVKSLTGFREILNETFQYDLAENSRVETTGYWKNIERYSGSKICDGDNDTFWAAAEKDENPSFTVTLDAPKTFDRIELQEPVRYGQRISGFIIEGWINDEWIELTGGTTIGYKRLLRIDPVKTDRIRIKITGYNNIPAISSFGIYKASKKENGEF